MADGGSQTLVNDVMVMSLVVSVRWPASNAVVVWLVVPTVSLLPADDAGENPSLVGTVSMAFLVSCSS
jgi:hypothetical protein